MQMIAADPFWASGTFWGAAGVITTVLVGIGAIWATLRSAHPKRRIAYEFEATALGSRNHTLGSTLELRLNRMVLSNPHIVRVAIKNTGRRDVPSSAFDNATPIRVRLETPILEVLNAESVPREAQIPTYEIAEHEFHIKPSRIGKDVVVTYTLLVDDNPRPSLTSSLVDVRVTEGIAIGLEGRVDRWADRIDDWMDKPLSWLIMIILALLIIFGTSYFLDDTGLIQIQLDIG
ncbi:hypothetical protein [Streptomyces pseudoechinosporeus]